MNKREQTKLSIYISIAVISVFMTFIVFAFYYNNNLIKSNIENKATALGLQAMMLCEKQLVSTREIASNVSEQVLFFARQNDVDLLISKLMRKYPFLNAAHVNIDAEVPDINYRNYYYVRSGESFTSHKGNELIYNCTIEQGIFEKMKETGGQGWTETFKCERNNNHVVAFYSPIRITDDDKQIAAAGNVIIELSLKDLNDSINSLHIGKNGYAFLVSQDGTYLTHPDQSAILNKNLYQLPKGVSKSDSNRIHEVLNSGNPGTSIAYPDYLNFKKCWVHYTPVRETGWTLFFVVPYDELFTPLYLLLLRMLFFSVIGILVIFFIITYISNKLIQPLSTVTTQLKNFSNVRGGIELNTRNEIELVSGSLDLLRSWFEKFEIEQIQEDKINTIRKQDLMEASEIQMSLINTDFSAFSEQNEIDLHAIYEPSRIVSGDLYDFIFLDNETLFFTVGDASGKGLSAGFFMSVAQTILKGSSKLKQPAKIVTAANNQLSTVNNHQFFLTLFCGVLNIKTGVLTYCNAAHTSALIVKNNGEIGELEQLHGMPLGLHQYKDYRESEVKLKYGDSIVLYSDGVTELQNNDARQLGMERFYEILRQSSRKNPRVFIGDIKKQLDQFREEAELADDITLMVLKYTGKKKA